SFGLEMSLKVDAAEIYQPVRDRLALFAMLLLAMIGLGALALRAQIKPLATELVRSQQALRGQSAELARANAELTQALQTRDRFLATMSHELRTPLNAILGFSGTLLMKMPGPLTGDQEKQLGIIQANGKHLLSLINDLLDIAQIESGKVAVKSELLVVQEVIDHVVEALRPMAESKALRLDAKVPTTDVRINTDRRALLQIVMNLASNAIKYTERGSVSI